MNWSNALAWVQAKNAARYLGYSDWRLPNAKELQSIVDYTRSPDTTASAAIDPVFTCTQITNEANQADYPWYWSGTTHAQYNGSGFGGSLCLLRPRLGLHEQRLGGHPWRRLPAQRSQGRQPEQLYLYALRLLQLHRPPGRRHSHLQLRPPGAYRFGDRRQRRRRHSQCLARAVFRRHRHDYEQPILRQPAIPTTMALDNYHEYLADTNPTNALSCFRILSASTSAGGAVSFQSSAARIYTLYSRTNLTGGTWSSMPGQSSLAGTGAIMTLTNPPTRPFANLISHRRAATIGIRAVEEPLMNTRNERMLLARSHRLFLHRRPQCRPALHHR